MKSDVSEYCRKLRLKEYFHNKDNEDESIVRNESSFCPEKDRNETLDSCIDFLTWRCDNFRGKNVKSNMSRNEKEALDKLQKDDTVIIKQEDIGGAFVIMDRTFYNSKMKDHLDDENTYEKLSRNEDEHVLKGVKKLTQKYRECFTKNEIDYFNKI